MHTFDGLLVLRLGISIPQCFVEFNQPKQINLITANSLQQILVQFTQHNTLLAISSKNTATCLFKFKFHTSQKNDNDWNLKIITQHQKKQVMFKGVQLLPFLPSWKWHQGWFFHRGTELCHRYHLEVHPQAWKSQVKQMGAIWDLNTLNIHTYLDMIYIYNIYKYICNTFVNI